MNELIKRLERVIATGAPDKDGMHPISAEAVLEVVKELSELGTNLAKVGTDCISRQAAIDALDQIFDRCEEIEAHLPEGDPDRTGYKMYPDYMTVWKYLHQLPSAQPDIIRCKDCKHASGNSRICLKLGHSPIGELDFCSYAERREDE